MFASLAVSSKVYWRAGGGNGTEELVAEIAITRPMLSPLGTPGETGFEEISGDVREADFTGTGQEKGILVK